jgi:2-dehydro-3-deoxygalactonokinase
VGLTIIDQTKRYVIAIDGGTTNTRARLLDLNDFSVKAVVRTPLGARNTRKEGRESLEAAVAQAMSGALEQGRVLASEVAGVLASGMITCEAGLLDVPHVPAPAGLREIALGIVERRFDRIWPTPITFIPGIKTLGEPYQGGCTVPVGDIASQDIMRGEESETLGIMKLMNLRGPILVVLPGSHTKLIAVDEKNRIAASVSTIAGELGSAVASSTLLGRSLGESGYLECIDEEMAMAGFDASRRHGLGRALYMIRLLDLMSDTTADQRRNFLWGSLVGADVAALEADSRLSSIVRVEVNTVNVVIGGSDPLRTLFETLFAYWAQSLPGVKITVLPTEVVEKASAIGATLVALAKEGLIDR